MKLKLFLIWLFSSVLFNLNASEQNKIEIDTETEKLVQIDFFSQNSFLSSYNDLISQSWLSMNFSTKRIIPYTGIYFDGDTKSNQQTNYTDSQVTPFIGVKSLTFFDSILPTRLFVEGRRVHRTHSFFDNRDRDDNELRSGILSYGLNYFNLPFVKSNAFLENYFTFFYSQLYNNQFLTQFQTKQGLSHKTKGVEFWGFNEFLYDSFDFSKRNQASFDWRPGIKVAIKMDPTTISLTQQYVNHLNYKSFGPKSEFRTLLVIGFSL